MRWPGTGEAGWEDRDRGGNEQEVLLHDRTKDSSAVCIALAVIASQLTPGPHVKRVACTYMCGLSPCTLTGTFCVIICLGLGFLSETISQVIAHIQSPVMAVLLLGFESCQLLTEFHSSP